MEPREFDAGPLAEVGCTSDGDRPTLVFVRTLRHAPEQVWIALTDPDQLHQWAPYDRGPEPRRHRPATLTMVGDERVEMPAAVTRSEPPHLLEYTWGSDRLEWRLDADGGGTRPTLRHTVEALDRAPKVAVRSATCCLGRCAEHLLDGDPIEPVTGSDAMRYGWQRLTMRTPTSLGIEGTPLRRPVGRLLGDSTAGRILERTVRAETLDFKFT